MAKLCSTLWWLFLAGSTFFFLELTAVWFSHLGCCLHSYDEFISSIFLYCLHLLSICSNSSSIPSVSSSWKTLSWRYLTHPNLEHIYCLLPPGLSCCPGVSFHYHPGIFCCPSLELHPLFPGLCHSLFFWWSSSSSLWELGAWEVNFLWLCMSEKVFNLSPH